MYDNCLVDKCLIYNAAKKSVSAGPGCTKNHPIVCDVCIPKAWLSLLDYEQVLRKPVWLSRVTINMLQQSPSQS